MAKNEVKVDITADASKFKKGSKDASAAANTLEKDLKHLGPVGKVLQNVFDQLGLTSITTAEGIAGGLVAGLGLATVVAEKSIQQFVALAEKVREYSQVTGESAEVSSRQIEAFGELGVSADTAEAAMFRLGRAAATTPAKLKEVGIEVVTNAEGNIDLNATLLNVARAYQGTADAARRAAIVFAAFGKGGAAMIPILETNVKELQVLEARVQAVLTQQDLEQARKYTIQQNQLAEAWNNVGVSIGRALIGPVSDAVESVNENIYVNEHLDQKMKELYGDTVPRSRTAIMAASAALHEEYKQAQDAKEQVQALSQAQLDAANTAQKEEEAEQGLFDTVHKNIDAHFAYQQAQLDLAKASKDAKDAKYKDASANLQLKEAMDKAANAAVQLAVQQAAVKGETLTADQQNAIYVRTLQNLVNHLAPNSPLRKELQGYIDELNAIPASKSTTLALKFRGINAVAKGTATGHGNLSFDEGGMVPGPTGAAVPATVHGGEMVLTPDQQKALASNGSAGQVVEYHQHFHVDRGAFIDGPGLDRLANELLRRARYAPGK